MEGFIFIFFDWKVRLFGCQYSVQIRFQLKFNLDYLLSSRLYILRTISSLEGFKLCFLLWDLSLWVPMFNAKSDFKFAFNLDYSLSWWWLLIFFLILFLVISKSLLVRVECPFSLWIINYFHDAFFFFFG